MLVAYYFNLEILPGKVTVTVQKILCFSQILFLKNRTSFKVKHSALEADLLFGNCNSRGSEEGKDHGAGSRVRAGLSAEAQPPTWRQMATLTLQPNVVLTARAGRPRSLNSLEKDCVSAIRGRSSATTMQVRTHDRFTPFVCGRSSPGIRPLGGAPAQVRAREPRLPVPSACSTPTPALCPLPSKTPQ